MMMTVNNYLDDVAVDCHLDDAHGEILPSTVIAEAQIARQSLQIRLLHQRKEKINQYVPGRLFPSLFHLSGVFGDPVALLPDGAAGAIDGPRGVAGRPGIRAERVRFLLEHPIERVGQQSDRVVHQSRLGLSRRKKSCRIRRKYIPDVCRFEYIYRNESLSSAGISGRIELLPTAEELLDDGPLRVDDAEARDIDGPVLFDLFVPAIVHHLFEGQ